MLDLLVEGGQLVTELGVYESNVGIKDGKIVAILGRDIKLEASQTIDARGKVVMPGPIDGHVHDRSAVGGLTTSDTPGDVSKVAAYGGITTFIFYIGFKPTAEPGKPSLRNSLSSQIEEHFSRIIEEEERSSVVDFGIHCILFPDEALVRQVPTIIKMGISSFKMILGYNPRRGWLLDDYLLMSALEAIASNGGLAMFHCENGYVIGYLEDRFVKEGIYSAQTFLKSRPNLAEAETVYRTISLSQITGCPIYIVHLSTKEGLDNIVRARMEGKEVTSETCPQYLLLTDEDMCREGELLKIAPPLRSVEDTKAMWKGVQLGNIDVIGSDHISLSKSQKLGAADFYAVPFGTPEIETTVPLVYSEGVIKGRITLMQMAKALSENPAKIFGLYPKKGVIRVGSDADMVIIDPAIEWEIRADSLHSNSGYTPFEGWRVTGKPIISLVRGKILLKDGKLHQDPGFGCYIRRPLSK